jgi:hypothetical protein
MATPTIYRSTDASAPVLTGEIGKLIALLKACLVDGYGAQPAAGWTQAYSSGADYAAFQVASSSGSDALLWVNDTNAQLARVIGYKSMTAILSGTNPFPTETQFSAGLYCRKSVTANTTARPWILIASATFFMLIVAGNQTVFGNFDGGDTNMMFGDLLPALSGDGYHALLGAATDSSPTSATATLTRQVIPALAATPSGHYLAASYTQTGGSITLNKRATGVLAQAVSGNTGAAYPEPCSGGLHISRVAVTEANLATRGYIPGLWALGHAQTLFTNFDTFSGNASLSGKTFLIVKTGTYGFCVETNGGW